MTDYCVPGGQQSIVRSDSSKIRMNLRIWNLFFFNNLFSYNNFEIIRVSKILKSNLGENWFFCPSLPSYEDVYTMGGFVPRSSKPRETEERTAHESVSSFPKLWVFEFTSDCYEYRKWRKPSLIWRYEKSKDA